MNPLTKNEQIAKLIREIETSDEPAIITTGYMLELFEDSGFQTFLNMYGYAAKLYKEEHLGVSYYHIGKDSNRLNEDFPDEEL
jgi:hypothetical protein